MIDTLLDDEDMDQNTREDFLRNMKREVMNINFLVKSILKLSRLDTNTVKFISKKESVKEIIKEAIKVAKKYSCAKEGDNIIVAAGLPTSITGGTNMMKIEKI